MKFYLDKTLIFELDETKQKVLKNRIFQEEFQEHMMHLVKWVTMHNQEQAFKQLTEEWVPKLKAHGAKMIPTDEDELAELIFKDPEYKSRSQRDQIMPDNILDRSDL